MAKIAGEETMKSASLKILVSLLLISIVNSGCGEKEKVTTKKVIRYAAAGEARQIEKMQQIVSKFEEKHPDIKVKTEFIMGDIPTKLMTEMAAGMAPDVMILFDTVIPSFAEKGALMDLNRFIETDKEFDVQDFYPEGLKYGSIKGKLYLIPRILGCAVVFYNKDLFDKAGLKYPSDDWTWEDFRELAIRLTLHEEGSITQYGAVMLDPIGRLREMINASGGSVFNQDHSRCLLDSPEAIAAIRLFAKLHNEDRCVCLPEFRAKGMGGMGGGAIFAMGKAAMLFSGHWQIPEFRVINWDVAPIPKWKKRAIHVGTVGYSISSDTKYPE